MIASAGDWAAAALLLLMIFTIWGLYAFWIVRHRVRAVEVAFHYDTPPEEALREWAGFYTEWLASNGYVMAAQELGSLTYWRRYFPSWAVAAAVILFPPRRALPFPLRMASMNAPKLLAAIAAAALVAVPAVDAKTPPPQKKGATYTGITSQGANACHTGSDNEAPCDVTAKVTSSGKRVRLLVKFTADCGDGNVYQSSTVF